MFTASKAKSLAALITPASRIIVAYSGGVDSALLAYWVHERCEERMLAITCDGPFFTAAEKKDAIAFAKRYGIPHRLLLMADLGDEHVRRNDRRRCYYCKYARFKRLQEIAAQEGYTAVWEGSNTDDLQEYRPGMDALRELGIVSPYLEADISKAEIRAAAAALGLPVANKASSPCLATRFPYGEEITLPKLARVAAAEKMLRPRLGNPLRVRSQGDRATITCLPERWTVLTPDEQVHWLQALRDLGFAEVSYAPYRRGEYDQ